MEHVYKFMSNHTPRACVLAFPAQFKEYIDHGRHLTDRAEDREGVVRPQTTRCSVFAPVPSRSGCMLSEDAISCCSHRRTSGGAHLFSA